MKYNTKPSPGTLLLAAAALVSALGMAKPLQAQESQSGWDFRGFFYLWGASIGGETTQGQSIDVSFGDIVENLDFGIMGSLQARRNRVAVFGDAIYLAISDGGNALVGPGIPASADVEVEGFVFTTGVGYDMMSAEKELLNGFGGLRYVDLSTDVNLGVPGGSIRLGDGLSNLDAVVGLRGAYDLSDRWELLYYADIGAGDSDLTWQAAVTFDYEINSRWSASFGYRHLAWDLGNADTISDLSFSGPFVGAKYNF